VKVLAFSVTLVARAILETRNSGIRLQICRSRFSFEPAGTWLLYFFIPAVWQGYTKHSSFFQNPVGWLCMGIKTTNWTIDRPLLPDTVYVWSVRATSGKETSLWAAYGDGEAESSRRGSRPYNLMCSFKTPPEWHSGNAKC
jgi:hypothetical protein